jgi:hypothetical protein
LVCCGFAAGQVLVRNWFVLGAGLVDGSLSVGPCLICSSLGSEVSTHSAAGSLLVRSGFPAGLSLSYAWISVDSRMVLGCFPAVRGNVVFCLHYFSTLPSELRLASFWTQADSLPIWSWFAMVRD